MISWFIQLSPPMQAFFATLFTWGITTLGASLVFFFWTVNKSILDAMLGFAAGVMVAASFWSLLSPALSMAQMLSMTPWLVAAVGFLSGGLLLFFGDKLFHFLEARSDIQEREAPSRANSRKRCMMLFFSITLHNIPEGLAIGVAFGSLAYGLEGATLSAACMLALGIGLQNFPEGTAMSVSLRREGYSRRRSFVLGTLSGIVEPLAGVLGAALVVYVQNFLPFLLSFAAGAMIYVVVQELIPESQTNQKKNIMALFTLIGFVVMMVLDVALG